MQWRNISRQGACRAGSGSPPCTFLGTSPSLFSYEGEMPDVTPVRGGGERLQLSALLKLFCSALPQLQDLNNYLGGFFLFFWFSFSWICFLFLLLKALFLALSPFKSYLQLVVQGGSCAERLWRCHWNINSKKMIKNSLSPWMVALEFKDYSWLRRPPWLSPGGTFNLFLNASPCSSLLRKLRHFKHTAKSGFLSKDSHRIFCDKFMN